MALNFNRRTLSNREITNEFGRAVSTEAFCNVGHNRYAGALDLVAQTKVLAKCPFCGNPINFGTEFPCGPPALNVLESGDDHVTTVHSHQENSPPTTRN